MHLQYKRNSVSFDSRKIASLTAAAVAAAVKKPTAAADSNNSLLLSSPLLNSNFYLSPSSACTTKHNLQRRRNSFAAASTINDKNSMIMSGESSQNTGSTHFLNPSMTAVCRRRLPLTPSSVLILDKEIDTTNNAYIIRRGSSPRILPTPPPHSPTKNTFYSPNIEPLCSIQSLPKHVNELSSIDLKYSASILLERRPSTGRRLPPEPNINTNNNYHNNSFLNNENDTLFDNNILLQRSASARGLQQFQIK